MKKPISDYRLTAYDRNLLPSHFLAFLEESVGGPEDWIPRSGRSLGQPGWGLLYHMMLARLDPHGPNLVIETGTNLGSTTIVVAQAIKDSGRTGRIRTVEFDPLIASEAKQRVELAGLSEYVDFYVGDSLEHLPAMISGNVPLGVALLDADHFHDHVVTEFELVHPALDDDSLVVFDNTYLIAEGDEDPRVNGALRTILSRFGGNLVNLPFCSWYTPGMAIWQRKPFEDMAPPDAESFTPRKAG